MTKVALCIPFVFLSSVSFAETIQLGPYSGKEGYFAKVDPGFSTTLAVVLETAQAKRFLRRLRFDGLGGFKTCEVVGERKSGGYRITRMISCK